MGSCAGYIEFDPIDLLERIGVRVGLHYRGPQSAFGEATYQFAGIAITIIHIFVRAITCRVDYKNFSPSFIADSIRDDNRN
jgi:hypothetical protein